MDELEELYQDIILDHYRRPRGEGELDPSTGKADGFNPLCGDKVTVWVREKGGVLDGVGFVGEGCAISQASASIMTGMVKGKTVEEFAAKLAEVVELLIGEEEPEADLMVQGEFAALAGVRKFPARIKCATLAWHALEEALRGKHKGYDRNGFCQ